jgi:hypothetical protein
VYVLMPSREFLEAKTRAWVELLRAELPPALERDVIQTSVKQPPKRLKRPKGRSART